MKKHLLSGGRLPGTPLPLFEYGRSATVSGDDPGGLAPLPSFLQLPPLLRSFLVRNMVPSHRATIIVFRSIIVMPSSSLSQSQFPSIARVVAVVAITIIVLLGSSSSAANTNTNNHFRAVPASSRHSEKVSGMRAKHSKISYFTFCFCHVD